MEQGTAVNGVGATNGAVLASTPVEIDGRDPVLEVLVWMQRTVNGMVDDPAVKVELRVGPDQSAVFSVKVPLTEVGKLIGKQGRSARSLRTILSAMGMKLGWRFQLDIVEAGRR